METFHSPDPAEIPGGHLDGGKGNDKLTSGAQVNKYKGGDGNHNDSINAKNGKKEIVDCAAGKMTARCAAFMVPSFVTGY